MQQAQAGQASGVNERERWGGFAGDHGVGRAGITVFPESCRPEELITVLRLERKGLCLAPGGPLHSYQVERGMRQRCIFRQGNDDWPSSLSMRALLTAGL